MTEMAYVTDEGKSFQYRKGVERNVVNRDSLGYVFFLS